MLTLFLKVEEFNLMLKSNLFNIKLRWPTSNTDYLFDDTDES